MMKTKKLTNFFTASNTMRYLLDTNIFLWSLNGDRKLKAEAKEVIKDSRNQIFVSIASAWEISIKNRAGKLPLKTTLDKCFEVSNFELLNINLDHVLKLDKLPPYHKDPFDRILISQAKTEGLTLITSDQKIWKYNIDVLKC